MAQRPQAGGQPEPCSPTEGDAIVRRVVTSRVVLRADGATDPGRRAVKMRRVDESACSAITPFIQQALIVSRADERPAHSVHHVETIAVQTAS